MILKLNHLLKFKKQTCPTLSEQPLISIDSHCSSLRIQSPLKGTAYDPNDGIHYPLNDQHISTYKSVSLHLIIYYHPIDTYHYCWYLHISYKSKIAPLYYIPLSPHYCYPNQQVGSRTATHLAGLWSGAPPLLWKTGPACHGQLEYTKH